MGRVASGPEALETNPPAFYMLEKLWTELASTSDWAFRVMPALFGVAGVAAVAVLARAAFGARAGRWAGLLLLLLRERPDLTTVHATVSKILTEAGGTAVQEIKRDRVAVEQRVQPGRGSVTRDIALLSPERTAGASLSAAVIAVALHPTTQIILHTAWPWLLSIAIGVAGALTLFPAPVLLGTAPFWTLPRGIVGGSWADMEIALSGYDAFVRGGWGWPVLHIAGLGGAAGTQAIFTDSTPVVALLGRLLFRVMGQVVPLFGIWSGLCLAGMALASTGLVRALGARGACAAASAAAIGVSMPALLARWGHLSLMAQALLPLAFLFYVRLHQAAWPRAPAVLVQAAALCLGALLVHPYLFFMVSGIATAGIAQAGTDRRLRGTAWVLAALAAVLGLGVAAMGYLSSDGPMTDTGFGYYSTNLLSPFYPQLSGVIPGGLPFALDGTGGQYEGFAYLGAGLLMLVLISLLSLVRRVSAVRHPWLLTLMAGFAVLAVSNRVMLGDMLLLEVPLPDWAMHAAGIVRSSGRFAWPGVYLLAALTVATVARWRWSPAVLLLAAGLQWVDVEPLRHLVGASVTGPNPAVLDTAAWQAVLLGLDRVVVDPPLACLPSAPGQVWQQQAAVQIQFMAAQAGVPTNTLAAARTRPDCALPPLTPNSLLVRLGLVADTAMEQDLTCRRDANMAVCRMARDDAEMLLPLLGVNGSVELKLLVP